MREEQQKKFLEEQKEREMVNFIVNGIAYPIYNRKKEDLEKLNKIN